MLVQENLFYLNVKMANLKGKWKHIRSKKVEKYPDT